MTHSDFKHLLPQGTVGEETCSGTSSASQIQLEKLAQFGLIASGIVHEINNPLSYAKSNLQTLKRVLESEEKPEDLPELLSECQEGIDRVVDLVGSMRSFLSWNVLALRQVEVSDLLDGPLKIAQHRLGNECEFELGSEQDLSLECHPGQLQQILLNLFLNAGEAMGGRGKIQVAAWKLGDDVCISVSDNGMGIPTAESEKIFDLFYSSGHSDEGTGPGLGLGLWISRAIAERHGGSLIVRSQEGKGSTFILQLPCSAAKS